jgi:hypothetical protein
VAAIRTALGPGWEVIEVAVPEPSDGPGTPEAVAAAHHAEINVGHVVPAGVVEASRGHPLWRHPRVLVSPHVAAMTARFWERETGLILANLTRYLAGSPLANAVDPEAGY